MKLSRDESAKLTKLLTLGKSTDTPIVLSSAELSKLIGVVVADTGAQSQLERTLPRVWRSIDPPVGYFSLPADWFSRPDGLGSTIHVDLYRFGCQHIQDFHTYLSCLADLHKRRLKFSTILATQAIPAMVQVSPRSLVEYGHLEVEALASWLTWRKLLYDIDNRAAQETGLLFEPILASALGGESIKGVVRRTGDPAKTRQVDCWKVLPDGTKLAYEFKLRVSIAASGQGRFGEELQFAEDCKASGAVPVLLVLDPTPNPRLAELVREYEAHGGHAYLGQKAWDHIGKEAGKNMRAFVEKYVKAPIAEVSAFEGKGAKGVTKLLPLSAKLLNDAVVVGIGRHEYRLDRR